MKNSGIEWIGEIPDDWEIKKLKYIVNSLFSGGTPDSTNELYYEDTGIPWIIIADMKSDIIYDTQKKLSRAGLESKNLKIFPEGTLLYAMYASVGKVSELGITAAINQAILALTIDCNISNKQYLKYCLQAYEKFVFAESNGNTQFNLTAYKVANFYFAFPTLVLQQQIADYLDKKCAAVDRLIENQRAQIEKLKEYKQSVITEAVTRGLDPSAPMKDSGVEWLGKIPMNWAVSRVWQIYTIILGKMLCPDKVSDDYSLEKYYCAANVHFDGISNNEQLKEMWFSSSEKAIYKVCEADLLVVEGGAGAGGCAIVKNILDNIYVQNSVMIVRSKKYGNNLYLRYYIESLVKRGYIDIVCNKATIPHFTKDKLGNMPCAVPPLEEQRQIADYLDKKCAEIDKLIAIKQQKIETLTEYKKSLIYEYVTGKKEVVS